MLSRLSLHNLVEEIKQGILTLYREAYSLSHVLDLRGLANNEVCETLRSIGLSWVIQEAAVLIYEVDTFLLDCGDMLENVLNHRSSPHEMLNLLRDLIQRVLRLHGIMGTNAFIG